MNCLSYCPVQTSNANRIYIKVTFYKYLIKGFANWTFEIKTVYRLYTKTVFVSVTSIQNGEQKSMNELHWYYFVLLGQKIMAFRLQHQQLQQQQCRSQTLTQKLRAYSARHVKLARVIWHTPSISWLSVSKRNSWGTEWKNPLFQSLESS